MATERRVTAEHPVIFTADEVPIRDRVLGELARLQEGGLRASLLRADTRLVVLYEALPTSGDPGVTDVLVVVPSGYAGAMIDLAALPLGSPLLPRVKGGTNTQGQVTTADGRGWQLASYHPHQNGGGPAWDPMKHGFHTYLQHLLSWLTRLD